jgi:hypothetical protein
VEGLESRTMDVETGWDGSEAENGKREKASVSAIGLRRQCASRDVVHATRLTLIPSQALPIPTSPFPFQYVLGPFRISALSSASPSTMPISNMTGLAWVILFSLVDPPPPPPTLLTHPTMPALRISRSVRLSKKASEYPEAAYARWRRRRVIMAREVMMTDFEEGTSGRSGETRGDVSRI